MLAPVPSTLHPPLVFSLSRGISGITRHTALVWNVKITGILPGLAGHASRSCFVWDTRGNGDGSAWRLGSPSRGCWGTSQHLSSVPSTFLLLSVPEESPLVTGCEEPWPEGNSWGCSKCLFTFLLDVSVLYWKVAGLCFCTNSLTHIFPTLQRPARAQPHLSGGFLLNPRKPRAAGGHGGPRQLRKPCLPHFPLDALSTLFQWNYSAGPLATPSQTRRAAPLIDCQ